MTVTIGMCIGFSKGLNPMIEGGIIGLGCSALYFGGIIVGNKDAESRRE